MSDKSGGFFSSVGRFFSSSKNNQKESETFRSLSPGKTESSSSPISSSLVGSSFLKDIIAIDSQTEAATPKKSGSNLRYLSPSVLDYSARKINTLNGLEIDIEPVSDIFNSSVVSTNRKRQLTETEKTLLPQSFRSESVKRSRFLPNRSLMEPNLMFTLGTSKLDNTWSGEFSAAHSPASSVTGLSLLSRRSGTTSNGSNLSSRTQQLLRRLNEADTPAKDVQRMKMIRTGLSRPEKWATTSSNATLSDAPPLRKAADNVPSRIQLLSKTMAMSAQRKPYWRDLTRKRSVSKNNEQVEIESSKITSTNGSSNTSALSALFTTEPSKKKNEDTRTSSAKSRSVLKGVDGKAIGKNTFCLEESNDFVPLSDSCLNAVKPLTFGNDKISAPPKGFLGNLSFSFAAPQDVVVPSEKTKSETKVIDTLKESEKNSNDESGDSVEERNSDESDSESSENQSDSSDDESDEKEVEEIEKNSNKTESQNSRPQTSTDTVSPAVSIGSSKNNSPKTETTKSNESKDIKPTSVSAQWTCDGCFTSWPSSQNDCGCCGQAKGGSSASNAPAQKTLVSNLASFSSSKPSTVSFGFGTGAATTNSLSKSIPNFGTKPSTETTLGSSSTEKTKSTFVAPATLSSVGSATTAPTVAPTVATSVGTTAATTAATSMGTTAATTTADTNSNRVAWDCPDCMVSNKETDDKCPCCGHIKYKSAGSSSNVFGDKAFKPTTGGSSLFGTGSTGTTAKFGFGVSTEKKEDKVESSVLGSTVSSGVFNEPKSQDTAKPSLFGTTSAAKPIEKSPETKSLSLFGATNSLTGSLNTTGSSITAPVTAPIPAPAPVGLPSLSSNLDTSKPLFGTTGSMFGSLINKPTETSVTSKPTLSFGVASTNEAPKVTGSLFGKSVEGSSTTLGASTTTNTPATTGSVFPSSNTGNLFGSGSTHMLFGATTDNKPSFGKPFANDTSGIATDGGPLKKQGLGETSESSQPSLSFGSTDKVMPAPAAPAPSLSFGNTSSSTSTAGLFGSSSTPFSGFGSTSSATTETSVPNKIPAFGSGNGSKLSFGATNSSAPLFGSTSSVPAFGSSNSNVPSFGGFGSSNNLTVPQVKPTVSNSSSTNSLFNLGGENPFQTAGASGVSNRFNFASTTPASSLNGGVFVFGSSAPAAPAPTAQNGPGFAFGGAPSIPGGMENAFSYQPPSQSAGARKMATARRRNLRK